MIMIHDLIWQHSVYTILPPFSSILESENHSDREKNRERVTKYIKTSKTPDFNSENGFFCWVLQDKCCHLSVQMLSQPWQTRSQYAVASPPWPSHPESTSPCSPPPSPCPWRSSRSVYFGSSKTFSADVRAGVFSDRFSAESFGWFVARLKMLVDRLKYKYIASTSCRE